MQKPKRKIGQRPFWHRFYNGYLRRDFRHEINRNPKNILSKLQKLERQWKRAKKPHIWFLDEVEENKRWVFDLFVKNINYNSEVHTEIYTKDDKTIIEGTIELGEGNSLFVMLYGIVALIATSILLSNNPDFATRLFIFIPLGVTLFGAFLRRDALNQHRLLTNFWDDFIGRELAASNETEEDFEYLDEKEKRLGE